jgi:lipid-binding SYLF domain-containing protein
MKVRSKILMGVMILFAFTPLWAAVKPAECQATMEKFKELGDVPEKLGGAYGYAVFPTIGKGGIGIGGAAGSGCVYATGKHTGNVSMAQLTIGFQLGGQAYSQLVMFQDEATYKKFTSGKFEFGADATAVALTHGAAAGTSTEGSSTSAGTTRAKGAWQRGMVVYTLAKGGLMYEASIGGQKYKFKPL